MRSRILKKIHTMIWKKKKKKLNNNKKIQLCIYFKITCSKKTIDKTKKVIVIKLIKKLLKKQN